MKVLNAGLTEYNEALRILNDKLVAIGKYIEVRAIGGYAMLYNGLRSGGYTIDVDTVTEEYSDDIKRLVAEVSEEEGIEDDWLNNDEHMRTNKSPNNPFSEELNPILFIRGDIE